MIDFEIKPALHTFDTDQTYDLVIIGSIFIGLVSVIANQVPFKANVLDPYFNSSATPRIQFLFLIERFTPWDYPWCEGYSTKIFSFLRKYGGTNYYSNVYLTGKDNPVNFTASNEVYRGSAVTTNYQHYMQALRPAFGNEFANNYQMNLNEYDFTEDIIIELVIPKTEEVQTVFVTCLTYTSDDYTKFYKRIDSKSEDYIYKLDVKNKLAVCSVVISSLNNESSSLEVNIRNQLNSKSKGYLYENLDSLIAKMENEIATQLPRLFYVVTSATVQMKSYYDISSQGQRRDIQAVTYDTLPNWYGDCTLIYANNDFWNNGIIREDINSDYISYYPHGFDIHETAGYTNSAFSSGANIGYYLENYRLPPIKKMWGSWGDHVANDGFFGQQYVNENFKVVRSPDGSSYTAYRTFRQEKWISSFSISLAEYLNYLEVFMVDSARVKEIHEWVEEIRLALDSQKFAYLDNDPETARTANLGYYVERIARVLGISVESDGKIRSIRRKKIIKKGEVVPAGWSFGQFGINRGANEEGQPGGNPTDYRDGIVYEQRSNKLEASLFNLQEIELKEGDYTLCENIPQLLDEILDDLDKALGWQDLGAGVIMNADGSGKQCIYEGLAQFQTELAYTLSRISQHSSQNLIATLIAQGIAFEILKSTGQKLIPRALQVDVGAEEYANVPYPGLAGDAPSTLEQTGWILETLAPILGGLIKIKEEKLEEESENQ